MIVYATGDDLLSGWLGEVPADADMKLRQASLLVAKAIRFDCYDIDEHGMPLLETYRDALRDATCQQVATWTAAGLDPVAGVVGQAPQVSSQSVDGGSVSYTNLPSTTDIARVLSELCPASMTILQLAGLGSRAPRML